jgi:hypothetical protein
MSCRGTGHEKQFTEAWKNADIILTLEGMQVHAAPPQPPVT